MKLICLVDLIFFIFMFKYSSQFNGKLTYQVILEWGYTPKSTTMYLSGKNITSIEKDTFKKFDVLRFLSLMGNNLRTIESDNFLGLASLQELFR